MAIGLKFAGFESVAAGSNPLWQKWKALDLSSPLPPQQISGAADLAKLNININRSIRYVAEPRGVDVWQSPGETWASKSGDCEDVAILKYAILRNSGIPESAMWMVVGEIASIAGNKPHAWLAVSFGSWQVMDIMFDRLIAPQAYINWQPAYALNSSAMVNYGKQFRISDILNNKGA